MTLDLVSPLHAIGWALVASLVVYLVFRLWIRADPWPVIGLGCGFWVLMWIAAAVFGVLGGGFALIAVPVVAHGLAGAVTAGSRSRPHGEVTGKSP
jgi:hypothetical protein